MARAPGKAVTSASTPPGTGAAEQCSVVLPPRLADPENRTVQPTLHVEDLDQRLQEAMQAVLILQFSCRRGTRRSCEWTSGSQGTCPCARA